MSGRRPIARWAWRMFRREWRQQLGVLVLLTVAVAAAVAGAAMASNASTSATRWGGARALVRVDASGPTPTDRIEAAVRQRFGDVELVRHSSSAIPGSAERLDVRAQDPAGRYGRSMLELREGRYPAADGQVALTDGAADLLDAHIGSTVRLGRSDLEVVGLVENPGDLHDEFALLDPDSTAPAETLAFLAPSAGHRPGGGPGAAAELDLPVFRVQSTGDDAGAVAVTVLVIDTLAMALVCLVAAAGFVVVAQRRQRQLGLLAAIGATDRHLRLVMLVNGVLVGVAAAVVGGGLGLGAWALAQPAVERAVAHRVGRFDLPWDLLAECLLLAVVAATAAAWWPARTMSRLPVMAALSRRPVPPRPVHRSLATALALAGAGVAGILWSDPDGDVRPLPLIGGVVLLILGMVLAAPGALRLATAPAGRLPLAPRIALRDLARHQARAAAALAAITLGLGVSVFVVVLASASVLPADEGNLSSQQLLIRNGSADDAAPGALTAVATAPSDAERQAAESSAAQVAAAVPGATVTPLDLAYDPAGLAAGIPDPIGLALPVGRHTFRDRGPLYVATPAVLEHLGIDARDIRPGTQVITGLRGDDAVDLRLIDMAPRSAPPRAQRRGGGPERIAVQHLDLPRWDQGPRSLVTESVVAARGWALRRTGWLVEADHALTHDEVAAARRAAGAAGLTVEVRDAQDDLATLRTVATAVGVVLAVAIVALTLGLLRGEAAGDLRTLAATGARARTRRSLTATTAGALGLVGAVMGTATAYLAMATGYSGDLGQLWPVPVRQLGTLLLGVPVLAAAVGWLLSGREPATVSRQLLD